MFHDYRRSIFCFVHVALLVCGLSLFVSPGAVSTDVDTASIIGGNPGGSLHMAPCPTTTPACTTVDCDALAGPPAPGQPFPIGWVCDASEFNRLRVEYPFNLQGKGRYTYTGVTTVHCANVRTCTGNCAADPMTGDRKCSGANAWRAVRYQVSRFTATEPVELDRSGNPIPSDDITR